MKIKKILILFVLAVALLGCGKREPRHIVILPDVSGSIDRESLEQALKGIDELAAHLQRGDKLTIIPIFGDAEAEASGKIIRSEVPSSRQAYDADLRNFRMNLRVALEEMKSKTFVQPGLKTDILGSVALAEQEFKFELTGTQRQLIILSDFIQEDRGIDFRTEERVADRFNAKALAVQVTRTRPLDFTSVEVYLGLLRSNEYTHMTVTRREALQEFWADYFRASGTQSEFIIDGVDLLERIQSH